MPTDPHVLVATVIAAVAAIRSRIPKIDGPWVFLVAALVSVFVSFAASPTAKPLDNLLRAGWLLVAAVGGMSGLQWAAGKLGGAMGSSVAASLPPPAAPGSPQDAPVPRPPPIPSDPTKAPLRVALAAGLASALVLGACGYGKAVCSVVDVAHEACAVIRYLGKDGKVHDVRVTREELQALAVQAEARQAAQPDGGAP